MRLPLPALNMHYDIGAKSKIFFQVVTLCVVTICVKKFVTFCVENLLHFALKSCYILRQKLLYFALLLHFALKVVTFRVDVTFCVDCYILRGNSCAISLMTKSVPWILQYLQSSVPSIFRQFQ